MSITPAQYRNPQYRTPNTATTDHAQSHLKCMSGALLIVNEDLSQALLVPLRCKLWHCPTCGPMILNAWTERIVCAKPDRLITLTTDPKRYLNPEAALTAAKDGLPRFIRRLRKRVGSFEYIAVWEWTAAGWPHVHLLARSPFIPFPVLRGVWTQYGTGRIVHVQAVNSTTAAARYITKYLSKSARSQTPGRPHHRWLTHSRHFFPLDDTTSPTHNPEGTLRFLCRGSITELADDLWEYARLKIHPDSSPFLLVFHRQAGPAAPHELAHLVECLGLKPRPPPRSS